MVFGAERVKKLGLEFEVTNEEGFLKGLQKMGCHKFEASIDTLIMAKGGI